MNLIEFFRNKKKWTKIEIIGVITIIVIVVGMVFAINNFITKGVEAAINSYQTTKTETITKTKQDWYEKMYVAEEEKYHVSNDVSISIGTFREEAKLEVLEAYDVQYIIWDEKQNEANVVSWLKVPGKGIFTVDLKASEFIIDNERNYVLARVPEPELTHLSIIYKEIEKLLFKNNIFNDSIAVGEEIAEKQLKEAYALMEKTFISNILYYDSALAAAESMIVSLIESWNMEVDGLEVEVEFIN